MPARQAPQKHQALDAMPYTKFKLYDVPPFVDPDERDSYIDWLKSVHLSMKSTVAAGPAMPKPSKCTNCGKPAARRCSACEGVPIRFGKDPEPVAYCGQNCQQDHWPEHKSQCQIFSARKQLWRAGQLLREILYIKLQEACLCQVLSIKQKGKQFAVTYSLPSNYQATYHTIDPAWLDHDEVKLRKVLLAFQGHELLAAWPFLVAEIMKSFIKIEDTKQVVELIAETKKLDWTVIDLVGKDRIPENRILRHAHCMWQVCLGGDELYALDLTVGKFGGDQPVMPWFEYRQKYLAKVIEMAPYGNMSVVSLAAYGRGLQKDSEDVQLSADVFEVMEEACLTKYVEDFIKEGVAYNGSKLPLDQLLKSSEETYQDAKIVMLSQLRKGLKAHAAAVNATGTKEVPCPLVHKSWGGGQLNKTWIPCPVQ